MVVIFFDLAEITAGSRHLCSSSDNLSLSLSEAEVTVVQMHKIYHLSSCIVVRLIAN
jgi:hypothetical protein